MNVLHVTLSYSTGGRREAIRTLALGLRELGVRSHLACLDLFGADAATRAECFDGAIELKRRRLFDWSAIRRLRRYCNEHDIDVVHAHDGASQFTAALALLGCKPALLMTFHRTLDFESARWTDRLRNAIAGLRCSTIVTASTERRLHYVSENLVREAKVICIPLGIDIARFQPDPALRARQRACIGAAADSLLVGAAGHFGPEKGIDLAIDAFRRCLDSQPQIDAHLVVLGRGDPAREQELRALITPSLRSRVHLVGFQSRPEDWFPAFDVFLHGARQEAFGLVLVEAMACGVPVVAARVGGISDVVVHGTTGLLCEHADAEELGTVLAKILASDTLRADLGKAAAASVRERHTRERYANGYRTLYAQLGSRTHG